MRTPSGSGRVLAVVVTYRPDPLVLEALLHGLAQQVDGVLVVDNTPAADDVVERVVAVLRQQVGTLRLVRLGDNLGIAAALNVGIRAAMDEGWDYVLMSDQDSTPAPDMVRRLCDVTEALTDAGVRVGCVNPLYLDEVTGRAFGFQVQEDGRIFSSIVGAEAGKPWTEILSGISSGSLTPVGVFREVGLMREDYFIDYVDTEWLHRARSYGYKLFGTSDAVLRHRVGEFSFRVWYLRWRSFTGYAPRRLYYRFRNFVVMWPEAHVPLRWKLRTGWYWLGTAYAYLLFSPNRRENAKYIAIGLWHGLRRRMGRFDG